MLKNAVKASYLVAINNVKNETIVNRSRFICYLRPCTTVEQVKSFVKELVTLHPQASHHCYAFITTSAKDSQGYGFSDDGEPSGTAGRPMLSVLQGREIGQVCAVVVRYFGGTKLGTGGLQRAYSASVRQALTLLQSKIKIPMVHKTLACQYNQIDDVLHIVEYSGGKIIKQLFQQEIQLVLALPQEHVISIQNKLKTLSAGKLTLAQFN